MLTWLVLTEIQRFKNVKINKEMYLRMVSGPTALRPYDHIFLGRFPRFQMAVSCLQLGLFTPNLGCGGFDSSHRPVVGTF